MHYSPKEMKFESLTKCDIKILYFRICMILIHYLQPSRNKFGGLRHLFNLITIHYQKSPQEHSPFLNKWNRTASLTRISRCVIFEIILVALWQSSQTRRFFTTFICNSGGTKIKPNAIASLSL